MGNRIEGPFKACATGKPDAPYTFGVEGPGEGLGYHAWYLNPENTFPDLAEAEKVARMMNIAYHQGMLARSRQIRELIG